MSICRDKNRNEILDIFIKEFGELINTIIHSYFIWYWEWKMWFQVSRTMLHLLSMNFSKSFLRSTFFCKECSFSTLNTRWDSTNSEASSIRVIRVNKIITEEIGSNIDLLKEFEQDSSRCFGLYFGQWKGYSEREGKL